MAAATAARRVIRQAADIPSEVVVVTPAVADTPAVAAIPAVAGTPVAEVIIARELSAVRPAGELM
jgi:hypothetical protein